MRVLVAFFIVFFSHSLFSKNINFITLDIAPWAYYDEESGELSGIFSDVMKEIEKRTGYDITVSLSSYAFSRINRELESGRQDCTMIISSEKRKDITFLGEKVFDLNMGVIARKGVLIKTKEDFKNIKASIMEILSSREGFLAPDDFIRQVDSTYNVGLKKLKYKRVDAIVGAIPTINYLIKKNGMQDDLEKPFVISNEPIYLQCSKKLKELEYFESLNHVIRNMRSEGVLEKIVKKHSWY
ncbi:substrate-binding periplasmic protein [Eionea flava]